MQEVTPSPSPKATITPSDNPVANKHLGIPEFSIGQTAQIDTKLGRGKLTILGAKEINDDLLKKALNTDRVISIEIEYENESRKPFMYLYPYDFVVRDSKDTILVPYIVFDEEEKKTNSITPNEKTVQKELIYGINDSENHLRMEFYDSAQELEPLFAFEFDF